MKTSLPIIACLVAISCTTNPSVNEPVEIAYVNATVIDGNGGSPIIDAVMIVSEGRIKAIGPRANTQVPENATVEDLAGQYVIPGLINSHGHVGDVKGIEGGHYSRENVIENLAMYARYGITSVVSLGNDRSESVALRDVNDTTSGHARLYIAGDVVSGNTVAEAVAVVEKNHAMGVDWMKIRVDDNLGTSKKMSEEVYTSVIQRSHELGYKIASHMYYLDDARRLLAAGTDLMAHSVRDKPVDKEFVTAMSEKKVCYCPTLTREISTFVYGETPDFFNDPFFALEYDSLTVAPLRDPLRQETVQKSAAAETYRRQLPVAMANLKTLSDAGVPIAFGTDSGIPTRFIGYFEHLEIELMAQSGMSPMSILVSATRSAAACMGLTDVGTLSPGKKADFIVLTADPLEDISNVRKIKDVFIGGERIPTKW